jgi:hypothetical protein
VPSTLCILGPFGVSKFDSAQLVYFCNGIALCQAIPQAPFSSARVAPGLVQSRSTPWSTS